LTICHIFPLAISNQNIVTHERKSVLGTERIFVDAISTRKYIFSSVFDLLENGDHSGGKNPLLLVDRGYKLEF
jgi:hypothetical protein